MPELASLNMVFIGVEKTAAFPGPIIPLQRVHRRTRKPRA